MLRTLLGLSSVLARLGARANWRRRLEDVIASSPAAAGASAFPQTRIAERAGQTGSHAAKRTRTPDAKPRDMSWDVVLVSAGESPIALIRTLREVRELHGKDLRDLESLVDSVPETLTHSVPRTDAESLRKRLEGVGARVEVRRTLPRT